MTKNLTNLTRYLKKKLGIIKFKSEFSELRFKHMLTNILISRVIFID